MSHGTQRLPERKYTSPGDSRWLLDVVRFRHLLSLLLKKGTTTRYYGSVLGWAWSYVKPAIQFLMYFVMIGIVLGVDRGIDLYPLYLFSGIVIINFYVEATRGATNAITGNGALVKKIYLPRELFPVAAVGSTFIHFLPQVILLFTVCLVLGWQFSWLALGSFLLAIVIVFTFTLGLGLFFGAINVAYRDAKNIVDVFLMFAIWGSPVLFSHELLREHFPAWLYNIYLVNPITVGVELFHLAFWGQVSSQQFYPDHMLSNTLSGAGIALGVLLLGQVVFRKLEGNFAQYL